MYEETNRPLPLKSGNLGFPAEKLAMNAVSPDKIPFVLFESGNNLLAVSSELVREMLILPPVVRVPNLPPEIRGVIDIRGRILKVVDLRTKLGLTASCSDQEALIQLLHDREQDHRKWLKELEACVRERRPFGLARDPHKCKFGQWYDRYKCEEQSIQAALFRMALKKMDAPHQVIHAAADEVLTKAENGNFDEALAILDQRRNGELANLIRIFEESRQLLRETRREMAIVVRSGARQYAMSVDRVQSVEVIPRDNIQPESPALAGVGRLHCRVAQRAKTRQTVLLLGPDFLFPGGATN